MADREAVFHLFFRQAPFGDRAAIAAGLKPAVDFLTNLQFTDEEIDYLQSLRGTDGKALFAPGYLSHLRDLDWKLDVHGIPEGELVFPHEPLLRVSGPLLQCQLVETALLNLVNFQTLVATKAARMCEAAGDDPVIEFGLRRAQGPDGGLAASRAAFIGGCVATSNVLAGMRHGIPVKGTHAHSWVMSFEEELESFLAYAEAMPNNTLLLVDTYDTLEGVRNAIKTGKALRGRGHDLIGIRLDSGDLATLSREARTLLDEAGFPEAKIVASNDLDENSIRSLKNDGARIDIWGVGTKLVTAYDQPALGGVYKLGAIRDTEGTWQYRVKLSNDLIKVSNPGILQIERQRDADGRITSDRLFNEADETPGTTNPENLLLKPVLRCGKSVRDLGQIKDRQARALEEWPKRPKDGEDPLVLDPALEETKRELLKKNGFQP